MEHLTITLDLPPDTATTTQAMVRVRYLNGKQLPNWQQGPNFIEYIRQLMKEGWQLCSTHGARTLVFQRPRPDASK